MYQGKVNLNCIFHDTMKGGGVMNDFIVHLLKLHLKEL